MSRVSPAACAAVLGRLTPRSREIGNRVFTSGFDAFPRTDHIEVVYFTDDVAERTRMLERAREALANYDVTSAHGPATAIGGMEEQDYLEVRSERWGR